MVRNSSARNAVPLGPLDDEERAVLVEALSALEDARDYAAELETKWTEQGRARRETLFGEARVAHRLLVRAQR